MTGSRRRAIGISVLVLLVGAGVAIAFGVRFFREPDRDRYVAKNGHVVANLPLPQGAHERTRQILRDEAALFDEQLSHTVGYTTYVTYTVPATLTSRDIVRFYSRRLTGWRGRSWLVDRTLFACFARNGATVSVQTEGMELRAGAAQKSYGIAVNHRGGNCT